MAKTFTTSSEFDCSADFLFELFADVAFQEARALALGATQARCVIESESAGEVVVRVEATRASYGGRGEERSIMRMWLDRRTRGSRWTQTVVGYEDRASVEGTSDVEDLGGSRARLVVKGTIAIRIPVLGRVIESKIVGAIDRLAATEAEFIRGRLRDEA